jgi:hypothetical protein
MRRLLFLPLSLVLATTVSAGAAGSASGSAALALAGVVAPHSPLVGVPDKKVIARLFGGDTGFGYAGNNKISVTADLIVCRLSNVDIATRSCELTFGATKRTVKGRAANELSAVLAFAGAPSEGTAGATIESISKLVCTLDPNEIKQKAGGGAECMYEAAP